MKSDLLLELVMYSHRLIAIAGSQRDKHALIVVPAPADVERPSSSVEPATSIAHEAASLEFTELNFGFPNWDVSSGEEVADNNPVFVHRNDELAGSKNDRKAAQRPRKVDQRWVECCTNDRWDQKERNTNDDEA